MKQLYYFDLPEIVFLDGNSHNGNVFEYRTVILHIPTNTLVEAILLDGLEELHLRVPMHKLNYVNRYGIEEHYALAVHHSNVEDGYLTDVLSDISAWYRDYMDWEDLNIATDSQAHTN